MGGVDPLVVGVVQLGIAAQRQAAAQRLAQQLGADALLVFAADREVDAWLPAPGFPQTLPRGHQWQAFLRACAAAGEHRGTLPYPDAASELPALGIAAGDAVLVVLGGGPRGEALATVRALLPLLAAALQGERTAQVAAAQARIAQETAARAEALAEVLARTRQELEQALRTREEFLAAAAHDLKTPLAAIKGTAQLLRGRVARGASLPPERLQEALGAIDLAATRMGALVDELLDAARLYMQRPLDLDRQPTDLVALARAVAAEVQLATEQHVIEVRAAVPTLVGPFDSRRLARVLANLVGNAVKYSPHGGTVTIEVEPATEADRSWAVLHVRDQGLGIPPEDLPHIFERFHRGSNVVGRISGTGIGLASARHAVEAHGGTLSVSSVLGRGSCFTIRLPLAQSVEGLGRPPSTADPSRTAAGPPSGQ
jgi:signal transduction histidine kinase